MSVHGMAINGIDSTYVDLFINLIVLRDHSSVGRQHRVPNSTV